MTRVEARGDDYAFDISRVGYRSERQSESGGFQTELRRRMTIDGGRRLQTVADSVEMLFDSVG